MNNTKLKYPKEIHTALTETETISLMKTEAYNFFSQYDYYGLKINKYSSFGFNEKIDIKKTVEKFKKSEEGKKAIKNYTLQQLENKVKRYETIRKELDFCLYDNKRYVDLIDKIEQHTYCSVLKMLEQFKDQYILKNRISNTNYILRYNDYKNKTIKCN